MLMLELNLSKVKVGSEANVAIATVHQKIAACSHSVHSYSYDKRYKAAAWICARGGRVCALKSSS